MSAALAKGLKKLKKGGNKKVKSYDVSNDDSPPWDTNDIEKAAADLGVRAYGEAELEDEYEDEQQAKFAKGMKRVSKRVANKHQAYNSPATQEQVTRMALASVLRQIPEAEKAYRASKGERAAYAYIALNNQARELMNDLRNMSSTDALADRAIHEAVQPAFMQLINFIIVEVAAIRTKTNSGTNLEILRRNTHEQLTELLEQLGEFGQETLDKANEAIRKSLRN